jgi:tellurium resistance protein TerD
MAISLSKGGNVSLSKSAPGLKKIQIGLGWDARATEGHDFDLDASVFMLGENGKVRGDDDFIFYGNLLSKCKSVQHMGDNRTGAGEGDDESIIVDLEKVPADIQKLSITVTIHEADQRRQNFGQVASGYMRILDAGNNTELARFDLSEDYSTETAMIFGEVYRYSGEWKFKAVGQGFSGGLAAMCKNYGIQVA